MNAMKAFTESLIWYKSHAVPRFERVETELRLGNTDEALRLVREALEWADR